MGHDFEKELCHTLYDNGFWVHNLTQNAAGQPFDVIAVRNARAYAIDAKVCANDVFPLSRIEENQRYAMSLWMECGNTYPFFAVQLSDGLVVMLSWFWLQRLEQSGVKQLNRDEIFETGLTLERWVDGCV